MFGIYYINIFWSVRLEQAHSSLTQLIASEGVPAGLELPQDLGDELLQVLEGAVQTLVVDLEAMIPAVRDALITGDHASMLNALAQFSGRLRPVL